MPGVSEADEAVDAGMVEEVHGAERGEVEVGKRRTHSRTFRCRRLFSTV